MYYHFGLMCLLTPYVLEPIALDSTGTLPMVVCQQSAVDIGNVLRVYGVIQNGVHLLAPIVRRGSLGYRQRLMHAGSINPLRETPKC